MTFSSKLRADYIKLVNQYLDNIPINNPEEFTLVIEALKAILKSDKSNDKPLLTDKVCVIKELLNGPEIYVKDKADYPEFKKIILERVARKIKELDLLGTEEKNRYILEQTKKKEDAIQNQTIIAKHQPPEKGSDAHTIPDENLLYPEQGDNNTIRNARLWWERLVTPLLIELDRIIPEIVNSLRN